MHNPRRAHLCRRHRLRIPAFVRPDWRRHGAPSSPYLLSPPFLAKAAASTVASQFRPRTQLTLADDSPRGGGRRSRPPLAVERPPRESWGRARLQEMRTAATRRRWTREWGGGEELLALRLSWYSTAATEAATETHCLFAAPYDLRRRGVQSGSDLRRRPRLEDDGRPWRTSTACDASSAAARTHRLAPRSVPSTQQDVPPPPSLSSLPCFSLPRRMVLWLQRARGGLLRWSMYSPAIKMVRYSSLYIAREP